MRLQSLEINNFMAYKGTHRIDFTATDDAPVILFLGENGHGKSTVQIACKWCLYGETPEFALTDLLNRKIAKEYAKDSQLRMSVTLTWTDEGKTYSLFRSWEPNSLNASMSKAILSTDDGVAVPSSSISEHVQRFLAKEISHFFFFDGETQKEFDEMASARRSIGIKDEIEKTLAIPVIADAVNWLNGKLAEENSRLMKVNSANDKILSASKKLSELNEQKESCLTEKAKLEKSKSDNDRRIDQLNAELDAHKETADLTTKIKEHEASRATLSEQRKYVLESIQESVSEFFWLPLYNKLRQRKAQLEFELETLKKSHSVNEELKMKLEFLNRLIESHKCVICGSHYDDSDRKFEEFKRELENQLQDSSEVVLQDIRSQLDLFNKFNYRPEAYARVRDFQKDYDSYGAQIAKLDVIIEDLKRKRVLQGGVSTEELWANYRTIIDDNTDIQRDIDVCDDKIRKLDVDISKNLNIVNKEVPSRDLVTYNSYAYLQRIFEQAKARYTESVKQKVQEFASETFRQIISDKKYTGLRINDNYGVELVLPDGQKDPLRSTGQGKVSTIALVSGLIKTAMDEGFILMDTPFVSLDQGHRAAVCKWATESGLRVSLFMHSGEFEWKRDGKLFGSSVNKIYRIRKIDDDESEVVLEHL